MSPHASRPKPPTLEQFAPGEAITLGIDRLTNRPLTMTREQAKKGHFHIRGKTGSGKTSKLLKPLALQLMEPYELSYQRSDGTIVTETRRDAVFVFDFGGDRPFYHALKRAADAEQRAFKWFSLDPRRSYAFDPLQLVGDNEERVVKVCNMLLAALGLEFPGVYGGSYFTQRALAALLRIVDKVIAERKAGRSTGLELIARYLDAEREKDEDAVRMAFSFLARYPQLEPQPGDNNVIDFKESLRDGHVVYFDCPSIGEGETARQIGGLGFYNAVEAAVRLRNEIEEDDRDRPAPHGWVIVDEFQTVATRSFADILVQCRKLNLTLILANQSSPQLEQMGHDLTDIVRDNTSTRIYMTVTAKRDLDELLMFSKEDKRTLATESQRPVSLLGQGLSGGDISHREYLTKKLQLDEILDVSFSSEYFVIVEDGQEHREPIRCYREHDQALFAPHQYTTDFNTPIAEVSHPTPVASDLPRVPGWQLARDETPTGARKERQDLLGEIMEDGQAGHQI